MMFNSPFYGFPSYRRYPNYYYQNQSYSSRQMIQQQKRQEEEREKEKRKREAEERKKREKEEERGQYFDIMGIRLYFDDLLIIGLIFFLYSEGVEDQSLFISLILLLLT